MFYTLYLYPNSYALTVHAVLEELGLDHRLKWVGIFQDTPDPDLLKVSPHSRVPALEGEDVVLFETGAIALYLAEQHGDGALLIPPGDPRRGLFLQWFHYLATTVQPDVMIQFHPEIYFDDAATQKRFMAASMERLDKVHRTIDAALSNGPWFFGDTLTILDFLLGMQNTWPENFPRSIEDYPNIARHQRALLERPSVRRVLDIHRAEVAARGRKLVLAIEPEGW
jgi:glutathione S-transferase